MQIPVGIESGLKGVVDLIKMKAIVWKDESLGAEFEYTDIPSDMVDMAAKYREKLIETAVEQDDEAMESYLEEGKEPSDELLKICIRRGTIGAAFVPVLCGSAFKNKGVQPLLDAVIDYLPSPIDVPPIRGVVMDGDEEIIR